MALATLSRDDRSSSSRRHSALEVLDGRRVRELAADEAGLRELLVSSFPSLDKDGSGTLSRAELRPAFVKLAAMLGLPQPGSVGQVDQLVEAVFSKQAGPAEEDLSLPQFLELMQGVLSDVAAMLQEDPLVLSVFNGVVLRELAGQEEALEKVISQAFDSLDTDKNGSLSSSELLPVLKLLSQGEERLPPPEVVEALEGAILKQFSKGGQELSRSEFTALFKDLVLFMAGCLEDNPVVLHHALVLNGYGIRKLVANNAAFQEEAEQLFQLWDRSKSGKLSKADVALGVQRLGLAVGLPPPEAKEANQIYATLFAAADFNMSGDVDRAEFEELLKALLLSMAEQLQTRPVVIATSVASLLPGSQLDDGTNLFVALSDDEKITAVLSERFDALDVSGNGSLSRAELKPALLRLAGMLGMPGTQAQVDGLLDAMFQALVSKDLTAELDKASFVDLTKTILKEIAGSLQASPAISISLDGSQVRALLENSADFERHSLAVFEALDADNSGKLSMQELKPALQELGIAMGIPPAGVQEEGDAIVAAAVAHYGHGRKELSKQEFQNMLKDILLDIAMRLTSTPVAVGQSAQVLNGSRLKKLLANEAEYKRTVEKLFGEWDSSGIGRLSKADLVRGLKHLGTSLGLPPPKAYDAERVYHNMFVQADMDDSGFIDKKEFLDFMRIVFRNVSSELEKNPVILETRVLAYDS